MEHFAGKLTPRKIAHDVVPHPPQLETKPVDSSQRSPVANELLVQRPLTVKSAPMKLDHQLFHFRQTLRTGQDGLERTPLGTFDVHF